MRTAKHMGTRLVCVLEAKWNVSSRVPRGAGRDLVAPSEAHRTPPCANQVGWAILEDRGRTDTAPSNHPTHLSWMQISRIRSQ